MTDQTSAPAGDSSATADDSPISIEDAAAAIAENRWKQDNPPKRAKAESAEEPATAEPESAERQDADPETDPGEVTTEADPEEETLPPIERPRSWAKELDDEWASYPREAQEKIAKREQERDSALRRSQNEAAEIRKAAEADRAKAVQLQKEYEQKLPDLLQSLFDAQAYQFPDIKSSDDYNRMAAEADRLAETDPFISLKLGSRLKAFDAFNAEIRAKNDELKRIEDEKQTTKLRDWQSFVMDEGKKLGEFVSEADIKAYTPKAGDYFANIGFTDSERNGFTNGEKISPFDHRLQRIILNSMKYEELQKAPAKALPKTAPPVQRPGAAAPKGAVESQRIQELQKQFDRDPTVDNAYALRVARQKRSA